MATTDQDTITTWVRKQLLKVAPACDAVRLVHIVSGSPPVPVSSWDVRSMLDEQGNAEAVIQSLSTDAWTSAVTAVEAFSRPQQYAMIALSKDMTTASLPFRLRPSGDGMVGEETEASTPAGAIAQLMRHNEAYARLLMASIGSTLESAVKLADKLQAENTRLREARNADFELLEQARSEQHERELATLREVNEQQNREEVMGEIRKIAPLIAKRIGEKSAVKKLTRSLSDEQVGKLVEILDTEQIKTLAPFLLDAAQEEENKDKEQAS